MEDRIWLLMGRVMSKEASAEETAELQDLLKDNIQLQYLQEVLVTMDMKREFMLEFPGQEEVVEDGKMKLENRIGEKKFSRKMTKVIGWTAVAATLAILVTLGLRHQQPVEKVGTEKLITENGKKRKVLLPDSTLVWLNSGSSIEYEPGFGSLHRNLRFNGEGYFDVRKDAQHPLIIHTRNMSVKVLGTTFNLKAYAEDDYAEATLVNGKIVVTVKGKDIILKPKQKITLQHHTEAPKLVEDTMRFELSKVASTPIDSNIEELLWMRNKMVFKKTSFANVARDMERWFNVVITFRSPELKEELLSGAFSGDDINLAMKALQLTTDFKYSIQDQEIIIYR